MPGTVRENEGRVEFGGANERNQRCRLEFGGERAGTRWMPRLEIGVPLLAPGATPTRGGERRIVTLEYEDLAGLGAIQTRTGDETGVTIEGLLRTLQMRPKGSGDAEFRLVIPTSAGVPSSGNLDMPFALTLPVGCTMEHQAALTGVTRNGDLLTGTMGNHAGVTRHIKVDGSYALYGPDRHDRIAGAASVYAGTGKLGHFYRMRARDAAGAEIWSTLTYNAGELWHSFDGGWMRGTRGGARTFPITISAGDNATFGYTTIGGSSFTTGSGWSQAVLSEAGDVSDVRIYNNQSGAAGNLKAGIYANNGSNYPSTRHAISSAVAQSAASGWTTASVTVSLSAGTYYLGAVGDNSWVAFQDAVGGHRSKYDDSAPYIPAYAAPEDPMPAGLGDDPGFRYSFYATYTASGGGQTHAAPLATLNLASGAPGLTKAAAGPSVALTLAAPTPAASKQAAGPLASIALTPVVPGANKTAAGPSGALTLATPMPAVSKQAAGPLASIALTPVVPGANKTAAGPAGTLSLASVLPATAKQATVDPAALTLSGLVEGALLPVFEGGMLDGGMLSLSGGVD